MPQGAARSDNAREVRTLANGMHVVFDPIPHVRSISAGVWIKTGSANEPPHQAGISHLLEHLFFKGTASRTCRQLMEAVESRGGQLNAFTTRDYTCLYVRIPDLHVAFAVTILTDIIKNSQFVEFEKERNVVLEEIASAEDVPEDYVHDLLVRQMWPHHPLGNPVAGLRHTVESLSLEDVRAHYRAWCRPGNMVFAVAGNFEEEAVWDQILHEFDALEPCLAPDPYPAPQHSFGLHAAHRDIAQSHLCIGFPGPAVNDEERYAYEMLASALGGGSTSRLFDRIREQEGLAYAIYSFGSSYHRAGFLGVYAAVAPENLDKTLQLTGEELKKVCTSPMSDAEVSLNAEQVKADLLLSLESTFNRMARLAKSTIYYGRVIPTEEALARIDAVTAEDLLALAQRTFRPGQYTLTALGPQDGLSLKEIDL